MTNEIVIVGRLEVPGWMDVMKRVYSPDGIAPCIDTMQGGYREPKILIDSRYESWQYSALYSDR